MRTITICLTLISILISCALSATAEQISQKKLKLAFVTCFVDQAFFVPVKKGMNDAARLMDVDCDFLGTPGVDFSGQAEIARQALADGYDGLAFNLIDNKAFDPIVAEAAKQGVPVIAFNVDDSTTENARLAAVSQKFYEAGQSLAKHVISDIPKDSHILMTKHDENVSALEERLQGMQDVLKEKGIRWTTITTGNDAVKGADVVAKALRQNPDIKIVLSSGQSDTEAAGRAIEQNFNGKDYWAAGFDFSPKTLELIRDGHIRVTVDQQPYVQGFYPVVALTLNLRYGIQPANIDAGAALIDAGNVEQIIELSKEGYR